jgi:hypothetical protein
MINEVTNNGVIVERDHFDLAGNRFRRWVDSGSGLALVEDRPLTASETTLLTERQNADSIDARVRDALASNKTFLALQTPTNAQVVAQVRALTRQVSALIRMKIDDFRDIE